MKSAAPRRHWAAVVLAACVCGGSVSIGIMSADAQGERSVQESLVEFRHQRRVLLVLAPSASDPTYQAQVRLWADQRAGFAERDLVQLPAFADVKGREALGREYYVQEGPFNVVLIGKDGHAAFTTNRPVAAVEIFERIDAMPMRREEMRRKKR